MAPRKKPETGPILDSKSEADKSKVMLMLPDAHFNSVIKMIRTDSVDRVKQVAIPCGEALARTKQKRDKSKVVKRTPKRASDQVDVQSLITWMNKITRRNRGALAQLIAIDATCAARGA